MKKDEIVVGGLYRAKVSGNIVTVRVDAIRKVERYIGNYNGAGKYVGKDSTVFDVTNLSTGRKTTFRSAVKFRSRADHATAKPAATEGIKYFGEEADPIRPNGDGLERPYTERELTYHTPVSFHPGTCPGCNTDASLYGKSVRKAAPIQPTAEEAEQSAADDGPYGRIV